MNINWIFSGDDMCQVVTATFGGCRVTQYANGGMMCNLPAMPTDEEKDAWHAIMQRHVDTGKIWVEGAR